MGQQVTAGTGVTMAEDLSWLSGGGEMGQLIRSMDWSATALGPLSGWPQSLRTSVSLCLSSTFPILVAWGPDDIQIYNDAYRPICGAKHPEAMGAPFKVCWATALPVVGDAFDRAHAGEGVYIRDQRMFLDRYGYLEEAFMTFSFSPIRVESGNVGGIFHPITESTAQVLNARRTQNLRDLTGRIARSRTIDELAGLMDADGETLALDLPFMLLYELVDAGAGEGAGEGRSMLRLRGRTGLPADSALAPAGVAADSGDGWDVAAALALADGRYVDDLASRFGAFDCAPYPEAPAGAMLLPVFVAGSDKPYGMLVAGVSARRALDDDYRNFYELLRAAFNTAIGNVLAYEQEQRRAAALAEIDKAKTAFFSNVSHEFRTPLTLILGPLEDALADAGEPLAPRQRERIDLTHRNALRLLKLINSLLDFSRIEAGRVQARYAPVDLARLTANLASVFTAAMDKAGLAYHVETPALDAPVYVDLDMWEKIVFNLLSNAFKFTLSGAVSVTLAPGAGGRTACLTVRDTGSGIPAAELPKVFERFHRVEGVQGRSYEGTGIGLALIQELVRLHGGSIGVESEIGAGTAFHVEIPFGAGHLPPQYVVALPDRADDARMGAAFVEEALRWLPDEPPAADADAGADVAPSAAAPVVAARAHPGRRRQPGHARLRARAAGARVHRRNLRRRRGGDCRHPARSARPAAERCDDAAPRRFRPDAAHPRAPGGLRRADHPAVGARRRGGQDRGAGGGRRRLPGQAVLRQRAAGAGPQPHRAGARAAPGHHRAAPARGVFPLAGERLAGDDLDHRRARRTRLPQPALVRLHRPFAARGSGARLDGAAPRRRRRPGRPGLPRRFRRGRAVLHRLPLKGPPRRLPLDDRRRRAALRPGRQAARPYRHPGRRPRTAACCRTASPTSRAPAASASGTPTRRCR
jgi:signal transduction histidine kinase